MGMAKFDPLHLQTPFCHFVTPPHVSMEGYLVYCVFLFVILFFFVILFVILFVWLRISQRRKKLGP